MPDVPSILLSSGVKMPAIGYGTGLNLTDDNGPTIIPRAIELGYRMIDTAERYGNEIGIGKGLRASGIAREEMFIQSKFNAQWHGVDLARQAFEGSAKRLGIDYLDMLLIHWPNPQQNRYVEAWEGLIRLRESGKVRAIGVSNFTPQHLERIIRETGVAPDVNQIQLHPHVTRETERAYHREHGIVTEAWAPLGKAGPLLKEPVITEIAARHGRTPAQIVLRWDVELKVAPQPASLRDENMRSNLEIFDFRLTPEEIAAIASLNGRQANVTDPDKFGH